MKRRARLAASCLGALLFSSACGENSSSPSALDQTTTTTTTSTAGQRSLTIESLDPPPGSTVSIGSCGFFTPATCTRSFRGTFNVTYDADVQQPAMTVSFLDGGGRQCLYDVPTVFTPLVANRTKAVVTSVLTIVT